MKKILCIITLLLKLSSVISQTHLSFEDKALRFTFEKIDSFHFDKFFDIYFDYKSKIKLNVDSNSFFLGIFKHCNLYPNHSNYLKQDSLLNSKINAVYKLKASKKILSRFIKSSNNKNINLTIFKRIFL